MKTAVSLPDKLFAAAEAEARRRGVSRSQLYAVALGELLRRAAEDQVTRQLNDVYSGQAAGLDAAVHSAQTRSVPEEEW